MNDYGADPWYWVALTLFGILVGLSIANALTA